MTKLLKRQLGKCIEATIQKRNKTKGLDLDSNSGKVPKNFIEKGEGNPLNDMKVKFIKIKK